MLNYYAIKDRALYLLSDSDLKDGEISPMWVDIINPTLDEEKEIASIFNINISDNNKITKLKLPSCYYQQKGEAYATINIVLDENKTQSVSMILTKDILLTTQGAALSEHKEYLNYVILNHPDIVTPNSIFSYLIEANINDIEINFKKIVSFFDNMSQTIFYRDGDNNSAILKGKETDLKQNINNIGRYGHLISKHRESLISIRRALSFIARSEQIKLSTMELEKFNDLIYEVSLLEEHISFLTDKMNFLLDINFGMIDLEQNIITKVISIAALIFLPPAVISSTYGMNFNKMPFVNMDYGFECALLLMILSGVLPYLFCKSKRWI